MAKTPKLNQVLAIEKQTKTASQKTLTEAYHQFQAAALVSGESRTYAPLQEDGERQPPTAVPLRLRAKDVLELTARAMVPLVDVTAQKNAANCEAKADVETEGLTLSQLPATTILWLEKMTTDYLTALASVPTLPADEAWFYDENQACYATKPAQTARTKKIPKPITKAEATKEHPAQVELVHVDETVGYWTTTKFHGGLALDRKRQLKERAEGLLRALKYAREQANLVEAPLVPIGEKIWGYLLAP